MIIEFPKKYKVSTVTPNLFGVDIPCEHKDAFIELMAAQDWILKYDYVQDRKFFHVWTSKAHDATEEQYNDALCRLCEHIIAPPVDEEVWGDALGLTK